MESRVSDRDLLVDYDGDNIFDPCEKITGRLLDLGK